MVNYYTITSLLLGKIPTPIKLKLALPPPRSKKSQNPPLKGGILWAWGFPAERTKKSQAPIKLAQPFPAPELRAEILRKPRFFWTTPPYLLRFFWEENVCKNKDNGVRTRRAAIVNYSFAMRSMLTPRSIFSKAGWPAGVSFFCECQYEVRFTGKQQVLKLPPGEMTLGVPK